MEKYKNKDGVELNIGSMTEVGKIGSEMNIVQEVVEEAIKTGNGVTVEAKSVGRLDDGTKVSEFYFTWSFKQRKSK